LNLRCSYHAADRAQAPEARLSVQCDRRRCVCRGLTARPLPTLDAPPQPTSPRIVLEADRPVSHCRPRRPDRSRQVNAHQHALCIAPHRLERPRRGRPGDAVDDRNPRPEPWCVSSGPRPRAANGAVGRKGSSRPGSPMPRPVAHDVDARVVELGADFTLTCPCPTYSPQSSPRTASGSSSTLSTRPATATSSTTRAAGTRSSNTCVPLRLFQGCHAYRVEGRPQHPCHPRCPLRELMLCSPRFVSPRRSRTSTQPICARS
jgi:hypothetical protein